MSATSLSRSPGSGDDEAKPSGRKGSRKVRTGCITCKLRKVKCDEGKPFCLRCVKTGRRCDGYRAPRSSNQLIPSSSSYSAASSSSSSTAAAAAHLHISPYLGPAFDTSEERRAFDYYRSRCAPSLGGVLDAEFWGGIVLKMSLTEPAVRHALLATSSLHEAINGPTYGAPTIAGAPAANRNFALAEYNRAMSAMRAWDPHGEFAMVPLLVCVLFVCIEFMLDHVGASQLHICQGRHILNTMSEAPSNPAFDVVKRHLVPVFSRLSLATWLFTGRPAPIPSFLAQSDWQTHGFSCFFDARFTLYHIMDETLAFTTRARSRVYTTTGFDPHEQNMLEMVQQSTLSRLTQWHAAYATMAVQQPLDKEFSAARALLDIYYHASLVWIHTSLQPLELAFDAQVSSFAAIISSATTILGLGADDGRPEGFSFETELIAPVYWTATKCRHPTLRRAALRLLANEGLRDKRENLWSGRGALAAAVKVVQMEEAELFASEGPITPPPMYSHAYPEAEYPHIPIDFPPTLPVPPLLEPQLHDLEDALLMEDMPSAVDYMTGGGDPVSGHGDYYGDCSGGLGEGSVASHASSPSTMGGEPPTPLTNLRTPSRMIMEAPFGVLEHCRVKNTILGNKEGDSIWITIFRDPEPGQGEWTVTRHLVPMYG